MKTAVILNGIPSKVRRYYDKYAPLMDRHEETTVFRTARPGDGVRLATEAVEAGFELVIAAGGDGTVHEVVNGMIRGREAAERLPHFSIVPLGNGNDYARLVGCLDLPQTSGESNKSPGYSDVGKITCVDAQGSTYVRYFVNVADVGAGPDVVQRVESFGKFRHWGLAYYTAVLFSLLRYNFVRLGVEADDWKWEGLARSFAVANGQAHGHGLCVAPDARYDDGILNCFIAGEVNVWTFIAKTRDLVSGRRIEHPAISYRTTKSLRMESEAPCMLQADGELVGYLPAHFELLPRRLSILRL